MRITKYRKSCFVVLRVEEEVAITDDLAGLRSEMERTATLECVNIAVRFADNSMLRSSAMTALVLSAAFVRSCGGTLAIIDPNPSIRALLAVLGAKDLISTVASEEDLGSLLRAPYAIS